MGNGAFGPSLAALNGQVLVDGNLSTGNKSGYHFEIVEQAGTAAAAVYGAYAFPLITSGVSMTGTQMVMFSARPTFVPGFAFARIACTASPCPSTA